MKFESNTIKTKRAPSGALLYSYRDLLSTAKYYSRFLDKPNTPNRPAQNTQTAAGISSLQYLPYKPLLIENAYKSSTIDCKLNKQLVY
jgi:hypothetical protein